MSVKFCPRCHREAYRISEDKEGVKIQQGARTVLNLGHSSNVTMSVSCPNGHPVKLEIKGNDTD